MCIFILKEREFMLINKGMDTMVKLESVTLERIHKCTHPFYKKLSTSPLANTVGFQAPTTGQVLEKEMTETPIMLLKSSGSFWLYEVQILERVWVLRVQRTCCLLTYFSKCLCWDSPWVKLLFWAIQRRWWTNKLRYRGGKDKRSLFNRRLVIFSISC